MIYPKNHGRPWTEEEERLLLELRSQHKSNRFIADRLGRLESAIAYRLDSIALRNGAGMSIFERKANVTTDVTPNRSPEPSDIYLMMMLQEGYTTVGVIFSGGGGLYTYRTREKLEKGDHVVVKVGDQFKVAIVQQVDETPQIDPDKPMHLKWTVCKVDATAYDEQVKAEEELLDQLMKSKRFRAKEMARQLLDSKFPLGSTERIAFDEALARVNPHKVLP